MPNILNTTCLFLLILFTFSVAGMGLFGEITSGELGYISSNANFSTFYLAMTTLFRASTGESWPGLMYDLDSLGVVDYVFWVVFIMVAYFIFTNVFIAVIYEEF